MQPKKGAQLGPTLLPTTVYVGFFSSYHIYVVNFESRRLGTHVRWMTGMLSFRYLNKYVGIHTGSWGL